MGISNCLPALLDIKRRIIAAICALYRYDRELLDRDVNERSITHKLAEYLQREFPGWHVDCEYNRCEGDPKRIRLNSSQKELCDLFPEIKPDDLEAKTVFPDIIIHKRKTDRNLVIIEVKKTNGQEDTKDIDKIEAFIKEEAYQYRYGLFLRLGPDGPSKCELYQREHQQEKLNPIDWKDDLQQALKELGYGE